MLLEQELAFPFPHIHKTQTVSLWTSHILEKHLEPQSEKQRL